MVSTKEHGFTLLELVIVITIMSILSIVVGRILLQSYHIFQRTLDVSELSWQGYMATERIINDIHTVRSPSDITTAGAQQFAFTNVNGSTVQYQFSGTTLLRNGLTLATNIESLTFYYISQSGSITSTPSAIRYVAIWVVPSSGGISNTFVSMGAIR